MPKIETAEQILRTRTVSAGALLEGRADLSTYPFQLLMISDLQGMGAEKVSRVVTAAEHLMNYGWELVNIAEFTGTHIAYAAMRRKL